MFVFIQKEFEEDKHFSDISITIPFELPARLLPPFPQNEARLLPDISIQFINKKIIDLTPYRPQILKRAISISPPVPVNEESTVATASESSNRIAPIIVEEFKTIEGCTSSGIKYIIRGDRSSGISSRMSSLDERQQRKRKRTETPEDYQKE
uniref:Uncharacterized protein n=1 Tax=Panagrolaimus superbus TaxID=310955 RepID=A0A914Z6W6_9BILA